MLRKNKYIVHDTVHSFMASAGEASALEVTVKRGDVSEEAAVKAFAKDIAKGHWLLGAASQKIGDFHAQRTSSCNETWLENGP